MKALRCLAPLVLLTSALAADATLRVTRDIPYAEPKHERHLLDIYAPAGASNLPVVFWIHGGGWAAGSKSDVQQKPQAFADKGFVFVSTNYRLLPSVDMTTLVRDVAQSLGWVHRNIAAHGGDPKRIFVMGHSAGAQLAALLCTDDRLLRAEGVPFSVLKGCVPVDGDTFDLPAMIATGELRRTLHGQPEPKAGHRVKFGTPDQHREFSAVSHVAPGKSIPPFLILHINANPDTSAQAFRLGAVLKSAGIAAKVVGDREANHNTINANLGVPGDNCTKELWAFVDGALKP